MASPRLKSFLYGRDVPLSADLEKGLSELLRHIAAGHGVDVLARPEYLSTQQAAKTLQVSRPTLVKMLDERSHPP